jgi:hypothetical protein
VPGEDFRCQTFDPGRKNPLKYQHFDLKTFMQGMDEEILENIYMTST